MKKTILFDLDGTLVNSQIGVTRCVQYALRNLGIIEDNLDKLRIFIGPPLMVQFMAVYHLTESEAHTALEKYRERYHKTGIHECELYPDVIEALKILKERGYQLSLASSKPAPACEIILKRFGIDHYFDVIGGATLDGRISTKVQVLNEVLKQLHIEDKKETVLIGDTRYDAEGAAAAAIDCIGVTYGFGTGEELLEAGAVHICDTLIEAVEYIDKRK